MTEGRCYQCNVTLLTGSEVGSPCLRCRRGPPADRWLLFRLVILIGVAILFFCSDWPSSS